MCLSLLSGVFLWAVDGFQWTSMDFDVPISGLQIGLGVIFLLRALLWKK